MEASTRPEPFPSGPEVALRSGDESRPVVRVGDTVRRLPHPSGPAIARYLDHLSAAGFDRAPRHLGFDEQGREVYTHVDGRVPGDPAEPWAIGDQALVEVGRLLRRLHDASAEFPLELLAPPGQPEALLPDDEPRLMAHRDVTPMNVVFRDDRPWGVIDFELMDVTTRSIDLANTAVHWAPLDDPADRAPGFAGFDPAHRLALLFDAYGHDRFDAAHLLHAIELRLRTTHPVMRWRAEHLGGPWARLWDEGIGASIERRLAWFERERPVLADALGRGS